MPQSITVPPKKAAEENRPAEWFVYIIENRLQQLYTGITTDPARRVKEHRDDSKKAAKALRGKGPLSLRFCEPVGSKSTALKIEYWIKQQTKATKLKLIDREIDFPKSLNLPES